MFNLVRWETLAALVLCLAVAQPVLADCEADSSWFSEEFVPDPAAFESTSNCAFHQISWQYFLWLTQEVKGKLRFETMYSEEAINSKTPEPNENLHLVFQAGSLGILVDQQGRATYTSIMMNDIYWKFVRKNKLYNPTELKKFPDTTDFPVGSLSLKASWKIVDGDVNQFYTTTATIQKLANVNGAVGLTAQTEDVTVALVGLHIAVVVNGHPEAIWATFEHVDNAPNMPPGVGMLDPVSTDSFTFYEAGTTAGESNQNNASPIITLEEKTQKLKPITQVFRQYPYGGGNSVNQNNVESINRSVNSLLPSDSKWKNYMEVGAIWFLEENKLIPDWNPDTKPPPTLTGSVLLSSAVIETFTQQHKTQNNCFGCHHTMALTSVAGLENMLPGKNVSTSHILLQNYLDKVTGVKGNPVER